MKLKKKKTIQKKTKYLVLIFSDRDGKPSKNFNPTGYGGFCHNYIGYLKRLPIIAKYLKRKAVYPPPCFSLEKGHNNNNTAYESWERYFNLDKAKNLEKNPPFSFDSNGDIISNMSINYYPSNWPLHKIKNDVDIVVIYNFDNPNGKLFTYSFLQPKIKNKIKKIYYLSEINKYELPTSNLLIGHAENIIYKLKLNNYAFLHIRRGDFLDNHILAPPKGTRPYTTPEFICNFIKNKIDLKTIFISTAEKDLSYKKKIVKLLSDYKIIFEDEMLSYLPDDISNDNYCIYQILNEIAKKTEINIGTVGYVRLGTKYDYKLSDYQNDLNLLRKINILVNNTILTIINNLNF